jgi:Helix-turn-helix domain, rpiR family
MGGESVVIKNQNVHLFRRQDTFLCAESKNSFDFMPTDENAKRQSAMPESPNYCVSEIYPLHNLLSASHHMSESSLRVAKYIVENPKRVASMSIGELAKATGTNKTAVVRVSKLSG